jgi:dipeptidase E
MMAKKQIIVMGGGGFTASPPNLKLDEYVLRQTQKPAPKVCFIGTATGDSPLYVAKFYAAYSRLGTSPSHLPLFERTPDLRALLLSQDAIYVGGGNTKSMLAVWRDWGMDAILRQAWQSGVVLCGISAGAICWFDVGVTDSWADALYPLPCLGFLPDTCCPHYDAEPERRPSLHRLIAADQVSSALALEDHAAAHFIDRELSRVVVAQPGVNAYRVQKRGGDVTEIALPAEYLSNPGENPAGSSV